MLIDARGEVCPRPVLMAEDALSKIDEGIVEILVDNEASVGNITRFVKKSGLYSETIKEDNYWRIKIIKGYPCEIPKEEKVSQKDILLIIATDTFGKEEELGRILVKPFFETLKVTKELPDMIFFMNSGVRLTTINEEIIPILKELEGMGVEIYSCGTCLKYYNLEESLKVGYRGTTNHIVEGIKEFKKTIWIG